MVHIKEKKTTTGLNETELIKVYIDIQLLKNLTLFSKQWIGQLDKKNKYPRHGRCNPT